MEQFLNLFWLAITVAITVLWAADSTGQQRRNRHSRIERAVGLGCAFLLLFFVISMTDDLNLRMVFVEDGDQRHSPALSSHDHLSPGQASGKAGFVAIPPDCQVFGSWQSSPNFVPVEVAWRPTIEETLPSDRSPPASRIQLSHCR